MFVFFTALQTTYPLTENVQTNFTATSGSTAVLDCPVRPGALLQYYSARWTRNTTTIAEYSTPTGLNSMDPRYEINRSTFSLMIKSVKIEDSGEGYQCAVHVKYPNGNGHELVYPRTLITLNVHGIGKLLYRPSSLFACPFHT